MSFIRVIYFLLQQYLSQLGPLYLIILGAVAIVMMLVAPKGIWGYIAERWQISLFPTGYVVKEDNT